MCTSFLVDISIYHKAFLLLLCYAFCIYGFYDLESIAAFTLKNLLDLLGTCGICVQLDE